MSLTSQLSGLGRNLFQKNEVEKDLREELNSYLDLLIESKLREGLSEQEARRVSLMELGGTEQVKEQVRESRIGYFLETFFRDIKFATRSLLKSPGFAATTIFTIAFGIAVSTAVFSLVSALLLKPLPYPKPNELVAVWEVSNKYTQGSFSYLDYLDLRSRQTVFQDIAAYAGTIFTGEDDPDGMLGRAVTANFFSTLMIKPELGRFHTEAEDKPGAEKVVILGYSLWQRRFGGDSNVVGKFVQYNQQTLKVIGVLPRTFDFYGTTNDRNQFFIPLGHFADRDYMRGGSPKIIQVTARLKGGVTPEQATQEMRAISQRIKQQRPANADAQIVVRPLLNDYFTDTRHVLVVFCTAVTLVLLIACATVGNLMLSRAATRQNEIRLRKALGATRGRLACLFLAESGILWLAGVILGLLFAFAAVNELIRRTSGILPRVEDAGLDPLVCLLTSGGTLLIACCLGVFPALQTAGVHARGSLSRKGSLLHRFRSKRNHRLGAVLVITEIGLCLMLLLSTGLLVQSFRNLSNVELGFDPRGVLTLSLRLRDVKYPDPSEAAEFFRKTISRVEKIPKVERVSVASGFPLDQVREIRLWVDGKPEPSELAEWPVANAQIVSERYHETLGISLLVGRFFTQNDTPNTKPVVIVDDSFVREHFPGHPLTAVLGKRIRLHSKGRPAPEIIGIVRHAKQHPCENDNAAIYRPWRQIDPKIIPEVARGMALLVKSSDDPELVFSAIKRELQVLDSDRLIRNVATLESLIDKSMAYRRLSSRLLTSSSLLAMVLAAVGIFGVMSYTVAQRTHEIGIRLALGAQRRDVLKVIIGRGFRLTMIGAALGLGGTLALAGLMSPLLYGVSVTDPFVYGFVSAFFVMIALIACSVPAFRAARVNIVNALRRE